MKNYSKQLVLDYIYGNDIDEYHYPLHELENNTSFMCDVMSFSKDKNMYLYASDKVKQDYEFVKLVIELFKEDQDFIMGVADYYLFNSMEVSNNKIELHIIMNNLISDKAKRLPYAISCMSLYETLLIDLKSSYDKMENKEGLLDFGLGFIFIYDMYEQNPCIIDFFATRMINNIFYSSEKTLEQFIHNSFKNKEIISKQGTNNFIINYIDKNDSCLAGYVSTNINLIENINKEINAILNNWDLYEKNEYFRKINIINRVGLSRFNESSLRYMFCDYLETVLKKLGLHDAYKKYLKDKADGIILDEKKLSFIEKLYLEFLEDLVVGTFVEDIEKGFYDKTEEKKQQKIIKFPKKS